MSYKWKNGKETLTVSNASFIEEKVPGKGRQFKCNFLEPGLVKYSFGVCLLEKDAVEKIMNSFVGVPVIIGHQDLTEETAKDERVGVISEVWYEDGWAWAKGVIFDDKAINLIDNDFSVSCQYSITNYSDNVTGKLHNANPYDKTILDGIGEHLAIVDKPRYENCKIAVNAIEVETKIEEEPNLIDEIKKAINEIKESGMFKLFKKKEINMDKNELKNLFMDCLNEFTATNAKDEEKEEIVDEKVAEKAEAQNEEVVEEKEEVKEEAEKANAENKCAKNEEPDYKKLYEELKAKVEAKNGDDKEEELKKEVDEEVKDEEVKDEEKAKNSIDTSAFFNGEVKQTSSYISQSEALKLGEELY